MAKEGVSIRKKKAAETKKKIYHCADELFREYSFEEVSVDSIVEKAGISKGAFYVHFSSKDALIAELITEYVQKLDTDYRRFMESFSIETSVFDSLLTLVDKIAGIITDDVGYNLIRIAYRIQIERTADARALLNYNRELYRLFCDLIHQGIERREIKTGLSAQILAEHCVMALRGLTYEWCVRYPDFDLKAQTLKHFEILLYGLKQ